MIPFSTYCRKCKLICRGRKWTSGDKGTRCVGKYHQGAQEISVMRKLYTLSGCSLLYINYTLIKLIFKQHLAACLAHRKHPINGGLNLKYVCFFPLWARFSPASLLRSHFSSCGQWWGTEAPQSLPCRAETSTQLFFSVGSEWQTRLLPAQKVPFPILATLGSGDDAKLEAVVHTSQGLATPHAGLSQETSWLPMPLLHLGILLAQMEEAPCSSYKLQTQLSLKFWFGFEGLLWDFNSVLVLHIYLISEHFMR